MKNKIVINNNDTKLIKCDDNIIVALSDKLDFYDINKINIKVLNTTELEIDIKGKEELKYDISIELEDYVSLNLFEKKESINSKIQYKYFLKSNSELNINKFYECSNIKELDLVYLNGNNACINYELKTIAVENQKIDCYVYHNFKDTRSNIINKGVSIGEGNIIFNVTGIVYNGIKNCSVNQNNKIINLNNNNNIINPILIIEESDVEANHSAYIGKFDEDELFYLMTRGINEDNSIKLLLNGFLKTENIDTEKIIDKYWR